MEEVGAAGCEYLDGIPPTLRCDFDSFLMGKNVSYGITTITLWIMHEGECRERVWLVPDDEVV